MTGGRCAQCFLRLHLFTKSEACKQSANQEHLKHSLFWGCVRIVSSIYWACEIAPPWVFFCSPSCNTNPSKLRMFFCYDDRDNKNLFFNFTWTLFFLDLRPPLEWVISMISMFSYSKCADVMALILSSYFAFLFNIKERDGTKISSMMSRIAEILCRAQPKLSIRPLFLH